MAPKKFKAIIVGGSVAGLTLAHTFDSAGIDYVLLEGRDHVAPHAGATIVIMPNGARILDQLGVYEPMMEIMEPMVSSTTWRSDGRFVFKNEWPSLVAKRFLYSASIFERQRFLQSLFDQLKNKENVLVNKRVTKVKNGMDSASVVCSDGTEYVGDIVIGADGIHSRVRQEMQRLSEEKHPGLMNSDKKCITAEYNCVFGVSEPIHSLQAGHVHVSTDIDQSGLLFIGKDNLPQWFFVSKLDKIYEGSSIPRYTQAQMEAKVKEHEDYMFANGVSFRELMATTRTKSYLPLEEAKHEFWTWGRIVCAGDAIHKMTPNAGQGGNQAIESAAVLTNLLLQLLDQQKTENPSTEALESTLQEYQNIRKDRSKIFIDMSGIITRSESLATLQYTLRFLFKKPLSTKMVADIQTMWYSTAPKLEHLPIPESQIGNRTWVDGEIQPKPRVIRAQL